MDELISSKAAVEEGAKIGSHVTVGAFSVIEEDVEIGDGSWIGPNVTIMNGARIGKNCQIFPGAVISAVPQDLKFAGEKTTAEIGDRSVIREGVTINRGTASKGKTVVGEDCLLMANAHIGHDCAIGNHCIIGFSVGMAGEVIVSDWANISGLSGIHQFSKIGGHVMITGLSKITKDVPPYITAARDPLCFAGLNFVGLKRRGFTPEKIKEIQDIYRIIFQQDRNISKALDDIEEAFPQSSERDEIISFIRTSDRGIIKGYGKTFPNKPPETGLSG